MTAVKVWNGSAWVDSSITEKVWNGSAWIEFAPAGGSTETLAWPNAPTLTDADDGPGSDYAMGAQFYLSTGVTKNCVGVQWRVPDSLVTPGAPTDAFYIQLFRTSDNLRLANDLVTPVAGGYQSFMFSSPVALSDGLTDEYVAAVYTRHYCFRAPSPSSGWDVQTPSGHVHHQAARLAVAGAHPSSLSGWSSQNAWYYVSPIVEV